MVSKVELEQSAFSEAHLRGMRPFGWRMPSNLPVIVGRPAARRRAVRLRLLRGHRQDRPRARLRRVLRRRAACRRPARRRPARRAPARRGAARHRRSRPGRRRPADRPARRRRCSALDQEPVRRGSLPLVARQARRGRRPARRGRPRRTATSPGWSAARRSIDERLVRPGGQPAGRRPPRRRRPGRPGSDQLRRPGRHRAVPAGLPPRLADVGGDVGAAARRRGQTDAACRRTDALPEPVERGELVLPDEAPARGRTRTRRSPSPAR